MADDRQKISKISGVLEGAVNEFSATQDSLKQVAVGMGIDERRHVLIKDRFEDAVVEIAEAKDIIHKVAAVVKQDRE